VVADDDAALAYGATSMSTASSGADRFVPVELSPSRR
jgi:hypothetical protein